MSAFSITWPRDPLRLPLRSLRGLWVPTRTEILVERRACRLGTLPTRRTCGRHLRDHATIHHERWLCRQHPSAVCSRGFLRCAHAAITLALAAHRGSAACFSEAIALAADEGLTWCQRCDANIFDATNVDCLRESVEFVVSLPNHCSAYHTVAASAEWAATLQQRGVDDRITKFLC